MHSRRILYIISVILAGALAIMYRGNPTVILFIGMIIAGIADATVFFVCSRRIKANIFVEKKEVSVGENIELLFKIDNPTILFINYLLLKVSVKNGFESKDYKMKLRGAAKSCGETVISQKIKSSHTGKIVISANVIKIHSFLGLCKRKLKTQNLGYVFVFPNSYNDYSNMDLSVKIEDEDNVRYRTDIPGQDKSEVFDVREYREGDDMKSIHWKLTSKKDVMMVKTFSEPMTNRQLVFANFSKTDEMKKLGEKEWLEKVDIYIASLMGILFAYVKSDNYPIFAFDGKKGLYSKDINSKDDIYDVMKVFMSKGAEDNVSLLKGAVSEYPELNFNKIKYVSFPLSDSEKIQVERGYDDSEIEYIICK